MQTPFIEVRELLVRRVSIFDTCRTKQPPEEISFGEYMGGVKGGRWQERVDEVRIANTRSKAAADAAKKRLLPVIKSSGTFSGLSQADFVAHSGILCIDLDDVGAALPDVKTRLQGLPFVIAFHLSPRGTGLKIFVAIAAATSEEHSACWHVVESELRPFLPGGVNFDPAPKNVSSNCFVSFDPSAWVAESPRQLIQPAFPATIPPPRGRRRREQGEVISEKSMSDFAGADGPALSMSDLRGKFVSVSGEERQNLRSSEEYLRKARARAKKTITRLPYQLRRIFKQYLDERTLNKGERHEFLTKVMPPLFTVVGRKVLIDLLRLHFLCNAGTWRTPFEEHMYEIETMLTDWERKGYPSQLNDQERQLYFALSHDRYREAFRILRDLARRGANNIFFLSCRELGTRLGCHQSTAHETLRELKAEQLIEQIRPGQPWKTGMPRVATSFRWIS